MADLVLTEFGGLVNYFVMNKARTRGTVEYFKSVTWNCLNTRTINGSRPQWNKPNCYHYLKKGTELRLSKNEYYLWCESNRLVIETIYSQGRTPSIDRINSDGHYEIGNIRIIPFELNNRRKVWVHGINPNTGETVEFDNILNADRFGFDNGHIYKVLNGQRKTHKGFYWFKGRLPSQT